LGRVFSFPRMSYIPEARAHCSYLTAHTRENFIQLEAKSNINSEPKITRKRGGVGLSEQAVVDHARIRSKI